MTRTADAKEVRTVRCAIYTRKSTEEGLEQVNDEVLTVERVLAKTNGYKRGEVPLVATKVTMFVDLHDRLLYWCVCAWQEDFTGFVLDYGTFPEQRRHFYTLASATRTLERTFPGAGADGAIHAGLERLVSTRSTACSWTWATSPASSPT
jgi:hypothetical protein